jgi:hypothetical protein
MSEPTASSILAALRKEVKEQALMTLDSKRMMTPGGDVSAAFHSAIGYALDRIIKEATS